MTQDFFKSMLEGISNDESQKRNITLYTGQKGLEKINKAFRKAPIHEHLKAARDLGTVDEKRFGQLLGMLDNSDYEVQKLAEGIILGLKI